MFEVHKRNRLPHWQLANAITFVTFNLFDAVPREVIDRLRLERLMRITELERLKLKATHAELAVIDRLMRERIEESLDGGSGSCFMLDPRVAQIVEDALLFFDEERYRLLAWSVMPNHVHAVVQCFARVADVIHSWKSYTSKEANRILHRDGEFWQADYFDRMIRNPNDLERPITYVLDNPLKAGLKNWKWVGARASRPQSPAVPAGD